MGLFETRSPSNDPCDAALPPASSYRLVHCHSCQMSFNLCSRCDRGNIYCRLCAPKRRAESIVRARSAYRGTAHGKLVHAAAEKRRRLRRQAPPDEGTVGDQGSPPVDPQGNTSVSEPVVSDNGVPGNENSIVPDPSVGPLGVSPPPQGFVRCAYCHRHCKAFQIQGARGRSLSRRPRSRAPPHASANGGRAP